MARTFLDQTAAATASVPVDAVAATALNVDLHCHSHVSDGTLAPAAVVERAHAGGVKLLALTDHDELGGLAEASARARQLGLFFVPGVEVSVSWAGETVHVVGLRVDPSNAALAGGLAKIRSGRDARAQRMSEQLAAIGVPGALEGARRLARNPELVSRSHFARYLVQAGYVANVQQAFDRYLSQGRPGFVSHEWGRLNEGVALIRAAGGIAVLAHPARYRFSGDGQIGVRALIEAFCAAGGEGIEVVSASHGVSDQAHFGQLSLEFGLAASLGSDFHDPYQSRVDLGASPRLAAGLVPIWRDWPETRALLA